MTALGALAFVFYAAHVAWHVAHGSTGDLLWACNVACPMLAVGCFAKSARVCASAVMWLAYGVPMWLVDLATGGALVPTSLFTHFGGLVLGVIAVRRLGWPRGSWLVACAGTATLLALTRLVGSPERNANLAFRVHEGWEKYFPSHLVYLAMMWLGSALAFFVVERLALRTKMVR
ncbi:MAG TPA: hypothetical protein VIF62_34845 [Labilithrix sp.]